MPCPILLGYAEEAVQQSGIYWYILEPETFNFDDSDLKAEAEAAPELPLRRRAAAAVQIAVREVLEHSCLTSQLGVRWAKYVEVESDYTGLLAAVAELEELADAYKLEAETLNDGSTRAKSQLHLLQVERTRSGALYVADVVRAVQEGRYERTGYLLAKAMPYCSTCKPAWVSCLRELIVARLSKQEAPSTR